MNGDNKKNNYFERAQTMVEFALVLPILMMLIFGLLEVGRMAFIYVTITTASREAVRYGSASGIIASGSTTNRFADCDGIIAAAKNVDFLNAITSINISYDHGLDSSGNVIPWTGASCPAGGKGPTETEINRCFDFGPPILCYKDRIKVEVNGSFIPIVNIIPFTSRAITSSNFHTLLGTVKMYAVGLCPSNPLIFDDDELCVFPTNTSPPPLISPTPTKTPTTYPTSTKPVSCGFSSSPYLPYSFLVPGDKKTHGYDAGWTITNNSSNSDLVVESIKISWNTKYYLYLTDVKFGSYSVNANTNVSSYYLSIPSNQTWNIPVGQSRNMNIYFKYTINGDNTLVAPRITVTFKQNYCGDFSLSLPKYDCNTSRVLDSYCPTPIPSPTSTPTP